MSQKSRHRPVGLAIIVLGRIGTQLGLVGAGVWFSVFTFRTCLYGLGWALALTDGNLNRHLGVLEDAGLVSVRKRYEGKALERLTARLRASEG